MEKIKSHTSVLNNDDNSISSFTEKNHIDQENDNDNSTEKDRINHSISSTEKDRINQEGENGDEPIDPKSLDWDGPGDMDNPHNWPAWKKWSTTMTAAILCLVVSMGSSLYVSSVPELVARYHINQTLAISGLTFYLLGLSTVIGAPLSEVFGRKPIYLVSLPLSCLFTMAVGLSQGHMRIILPCRFLAGAFASPAMSIASGTIMDIFDVDEVSVAMTFFCLAPFMGPVISPIMSGFACQYQNWRWSQWILLFASGLIFPFILIMPETHKGIILKKRALKRNIKLIQFNKRAQREFLKVTLTITVFRPLKMLIVEPIVLVFSIYVAFIFAVLFAFFEAYPVIYQGVYKMDPGISGLPFLGIGIGLYLASIFYVYIDRKILFPKAPPGTPNLSNPTSLRVTPYRGKRDPVTNELLPIHPEDLLLACKIGSISLPIALFWQAWTARPDVHWMAPVAAGVPFGFGLILIFFSVIMYFSTCYPPLVVASAMAANNMLRYTMSSVFPLFTIQMYESTMKIKWASTFFAFICIILVPTPWIFERYGPTLRQKSQFGFAAMMQQQDVADEVDEKSDDHSQSFSHNGELTLAKMDTLRSIETNISHIDEPINDSNVSLHKLRSHKSNTSFGQASDRYSHMHSNVSHIHNDDDDKNSMMKQPEGSTDYTKLFTNPENDVISVEESSNNSSQLV
ncbi:polyamine transporter 4 [Monosporozyma servazzii]